MLQLLLKTKEIGHKEANNMRDFDVKDSDFHIITRAKYYMQARGDCVNKKLKEKAYIAEKGKEISHLAMQCVNKTPRARPALEEVIQKLREVIQKLRDIQKWTAPIPSLLSAVVIEQIEHMQIVLW